MDLARACRDFDDFGYVCLPSLVSPDEAHRLRNLIEHRYQGIATHAATDSDELRGGVSLMRMFEHDRAFRDLLAREPALSLVETILGPDCHVISQNALRTPNGKGIVNWHIDDALFFPFLADVPGLDEAAPSLPCFSLNVMIALSDVEAVELGPTQVVPTSHRSGRVPEFKPDLPSGITATSLFAKAGDGYLINSQTWHRGAQNESGRTRYLLTTAYGRRFISQRFFPFLNYRMPDHVLDGADSRLMRLLGRHEKGPYG